MNDPNIYTLKYGIRSVGIYTVGHDATKPGWSTKNEIGEFLIDEDELTVLLTADCADTLEARLLVEPFLRAWEIHADLTIGFGAIRFSFRSASWSNRNSLGGSASFGFSDSFVFTVKLTEYPEPPSFQTFAVSDLVKDIHARWCQFREGKEPLRGMANYVLTRIELEAAAADNTRPQRAVAARMFNFSRPVLDAIATAAALPGPGLDARKAYGAARDRFVANTADANEVETVYARVDEWLENALVKIMSHLARHGLPNSGQQMTMNDLPPLPDRPTGSGFLP